MPVRSITTSTGDIDGLTVLVNQWDDLPRILNRDDILSRVQEILSRSKHEIFIYDDNGSITGYLFAGEVILLGIDPYIEIHSILVNRECRGTGIGMELVRHCEEWAKETGSGRIVLSSRVKLVDAHKFYKKMDYKVYKESYFFHKIL